METPIPSTGPGVFVPDDVVAYIRDGVATGESNRENRRALDRWRLLPRVLQDVSAASAATSILGIAAAAPLIIAPMAAQCLVHPDGELAVARAAAAVGVPMMLSLSSTTPVEVIGAVTGIDLWFQLYPFADVAESRAVVDRAAAAGARVLVVTVDMPPIDRSAQPGSGLRLPPAVAYAHHGTDPEMSTTFDWDDLAEMIGWSPMPVVVKGVLHREDLSRAALLGAAAVVVSNHGGRVQDGLIAAIDALDESTAGPRIDQVAAAIYLDGAIETGADVIRAAALGAHAALIGRPILWALAAGGENSVRLLLERRVAEVVAACAVIGVTSPAEVTRDHVRRMDNR